MDSVVESLSKINLEKSSPDSSDEVEVVIVDTEDILQRSKLELENVKELSFDCEGINLSRTGTLCVVQISSRSKTYLFDVLSSAKDCIVHYLKEILENSDIIKIIHDVRMDSDALYHQFDIKLYGIHDTQIWDSILHFERKLNLNKTLIAYGLSSNTERDSSVYNHNEAFWATRPFTSRMIEWSSGDVKQLFHLYDKQITKATPDEILNCKLKSELQGQYLIHKITEVFIKYKIHIYLLYNYMLYIIL